MKQVEIKTEHVEIIEIEVPDYTEEIEMILDSCSRINARTKSVASQIGTAKENVINQIEAYIKELFKPLFVANDKGKYVVRPEYKQHFIILSDDGNGCIVKPLIFYSNSNSYDSSSIDIAIFQNKLRVITYGKASNTLNTLDEMSDSTIEGIAAHWTYNKNKLNESITYANSRILKDLKEENDKINTRLNTLNNFRV